MVSGNPRRWLPLGAACALMWSCGGSPTQPTPTPTPVAVATPTPAPTPTPNPVATPTPTPTPSYYDSLPDGPVVRYSIKLHSVQKPDGTELDEPFPQDDNGRYRVGVGDFLVFDSTQKNADGKECKWINDPVWKVDDPNNVMDRRGSSNPFLLRVDIKRTGAFVVTASVDGIAAPQVLVIKSTVP